MRFAISVASYFPQKDGVQFVTQTLAEQLVMRGHDVTVLTCMRDNLPTEQIHNGVRILRTDIQNYHFIHKGDKRAFQKLVLDIAEVVDYFVFVCMQSVSTDWVLDVLDRIKCEKILYMHGMHEFAWRKIDFQNIKSIVLKFLRDIRWFFLYFPNKKNIENFDKVIHLHEKDGSYFFFEKWYHTKNYVLENFAEDIFFQSRVDKKQDTIFYHSNYHERKNQELLLKASYEMVNSCEVIFVGSKRNEYYDYLLQLKRNLDLQYGIDKNITFLFNIERDEIASMLAKAKVFVMTSRWERYPITILEAMAAGTPVISTDVGIVKYIPEVEIVSYDSNNIAKAIDALFEANDRLCIKSKNVSEYAYEHYSVEKYIQRFLYIVGEE